MNDYLRKKKKEKVLVLTCQISLVVIVFGLWELFARLNIINSFLFSNPSSIIKLLFEYIISKEIFKHIFITLGETLIGLIIGMIVGIIIAIVLWWNRFIDKILEPFLVVLNALPKTALAPVFIIWVGTGIKGIVCVALSISLILTIISAREYFINVDKEKELLLISFKATKLQILLYLIIPASKEYLINLLKINIGMTLVGVIVGEYIVSKAGLGYLIMYGSQVFKMSLVMMGVLLLSIISFLLYTIVNRIEKVLKNNNVKK